MSIDGLSATTAGLLAEEVLAEADRLDRTVTVAVVDGRGASLVVRRSHPAAPTVPLAIAKAYTSAVLGCPTVLLEEWQRSQPVLAVQLSRLGPHPIIADFGGYPVVTSGVVVGGLGVSGARGEEDQYICELVLQRCGFDLVTTADLSAWGGPGVANGGSGP